MPRRRLKHYRLKAEPAAFTLVPGNAEITKSKATVTASDGILVAHTGCWHLEEGPKFERTLNVLHWVANDAITHGAELFLCLGDVSGIPVPHHMTTQEELALIWLFQTVADAMPVVILYGNHDAPKDLDVFKEIRAEWPIHVIDRPTMLEIGTARAHSVRVFGLPYPSKRWMAHEVPGGISGEKTWMEGGLRSILRAWATADAVGVPKIFAGHLNIAGSKVAGGEVMIGQEIEAAPHDLDELNMDYVALNHIHMDQPICVKGGYAGSPDRPGSFGETDEKSYRLVRVRKGEMPEIERRVTPTVRYVTIEVQWNPESKMFDWGPGSSDDSTPWVIPEQIAGAEVKLRYHYRTDELLPDVQGAVESLKEAGALNVILDPRPVAMVRLRSEEIIKAITVEEKIAAYWNSLGDKAPTEEVRKRCLEKIARLRDQSTGTASS